MNSVARALESILIGSGLMVDIFYLKERGGKLPGVQEKKECDLELYLVPFLWRNKGVEFLY